MLTALSHFRIVQKLGAGGMGEVYLAEDTRLRRRVALKVLPPELASHPDRLRRFQEEACAASGLSHPNILVVYETGADEGRHFIATEYVDGQTLRRRMASGLPASEALDVVVQVASALVTAHEAGIVHRDIKPENIMVRADGHVKVVDFGLAKLGLSGGSSGDDPGDTRTETEPGKVMGTVQYMSPEQARGLPVDERTDIFSLGVLLYEALAGHPPFRGETRSDVLAALLTTEAPALPPGVTRTSTELRWVLGKMLRKDRDERYQTAKEMLADLRRVKDEIEHPFVLSPEGPAVALPRQRRFPRLAVALLAALMGGAPVAFYLSRTPTSSSPWARTGGIERLGGLVRYDAGTQSWMPHLWGLAAHHVDFSRDGKWIAYVDFPEGTLCRSRADGSDRVALTQSPLRTATPRWSPDRKRIVFVGAAPGKKWKLHLLTAGGGPVQALLPQDREERTPGWSPDGRRIIFAVFTDRGEGQIRILDLASGVESALPGSQGKVSPRWSPDGRSVLALTTEKRSLVVLDVASGQWRELIGANVSWPQWSRDGRHVYYQAFDGPRVFRVRVADGQIERWADVDDFRRVAVDSFGSWLGLTPDDSPLVLARRGVTERTAAPPGP